MYELVNVMAGSACGCRALVGAHPIRSMGAPNQNYSIADADRAPRFQIWEGELRFSCSIIVCLQWVRCEALMFEKCLSVVSSRSAVAVPV